MLYKIQDIAVRRKDIAEREFLRQKNVVAECKKKVDKQQKELDDYVASIPRLEDEVFAKIFNRAVVDKDLNKYKSEIRKIHDHVELLKEQLAKAQSELEEAEKVLAEKKEIMMQAIKKVEKFSSLIEKQEEEEKFIATLAEDDEIEESFRPPTIE